MRRISKKSIVVFIILLFGTTSIATSLATPSFTLSKEPIIQKELSIKNKAVNDPFFDQKITYFMQLARFPALSTCIIKDDQVIWSQGYGFYNLENQKQATPHTIYLIASITKTIVGTALMQLYEQGFFEIDEDVNNYLPFTLRNPYFPDSPITFRMLLSHTASLNTNVRNEYYWFNFSGDPPFPFFPEPFLQEFLLPNGRYYHEDVWNNQYQPGEYAMYANIGFDLISYLVEIISEEPFLSYCQKHIFDPLKMYNTSFNLSTLPIDQVAIPYQYDNGAYQKINELDFLFGALTPTDQYWRIRCYPAGGLYTTINDLSHFLIAHMNQGIYQNTRILKDETIELMHTIQPDNEIGYGLAWMQYPISYQYLGMGHGGDILGVDTWMLYLPEEDIGMIYFANGNPYYGNHPFIGSFAVQFLIYTLFQKGGLTIGPSEGELSTPPLMSLINHIFISS